jgi:ATP/maltotriose-dependent transcriptional regulator MalT
VTGRIDAADLLEDLERRNLFLISMEGATENAERTFRYHALFAAFLQQMLAREAPERLPELHRRAAEAQVDPAQAIAHYLAAGCWANAAGVVERVRGSHAGTRAGGDGARLARRAPGRRV